LGEARLQDYARLTKRLRNAEAELKKTHIRQALDIERKLAPLLSSLPPLPYDDNNIRMASVDSNGGDVTARSVRPSSTPLWDNGYSNNKPNGNGHAHGHGAVRRARAVPLPTPPQSTNINRYSVAASNQQSNSGARTYRLTGGRIPPLPNNNNSKASSSSHNGFEEKESKDPSSSSSSSSTLPVVKQSYNTSTSSSSPHNSNNNASSNLDTAATGSLTSRRPMPPSLSTTTPGSSTSRRAVVRRPSARELAAHGRQQ
jgi:hypothetical protein